MYSYAALCGLFYLGMKLNKLAENISANPERLIPVPQQPEEKPNLRLPGVITSLLAGAMTPEKLQSALAKAQQAYIDLAAEARGV